MGTKSDLDAFLRPRSVAVVGATERPGAWGSFIMSGLLSLSYPGKIYPVNRQADQVFGIPASKDIGEIEGPVDRDRDRPSPGLCIPWARLTCLPYYPSLGS